MSKSIRADQFSILHREQILVICKTLLTQVNFNNSYERLQFRKRYGNYEKIDSWSKNKLIKFLMQFNPTVQDERAKIKKIEEEKRLKAEEEAKQNAENNVEPTTTEAPATDNKDEEVKEINTKQDNSETTVPLSDIELELKKKEEEIERLKKELELKKKEEELRQLQEQLAEQ